jgi:hypothetical protein
MKKDAGYEALIQRLTYGKGVNQGGRCECGGCGRRFSSLSTFDAHFRMLDASPWSECRDPATLMVKDTETPRFKCVDGVWRSALENPRFAKASGKGQ